MRGHRFNSHATKTLCSSNVETGSYFTITNELTRKKLITEKCLSMLIREEVNRDQIEIFRKMDLKNHEEIILSSEFMELDLDEFKLLFHKIAWKEGEDFFEKNRSMKCYFFYHLSCLERRSNFKSLTCDAFILYKVRNKLL